MSEQNDFLDCIKDIEYFICNYIDNFYESKIINYKENLTLGNPENIRFQEFYLRNLLKISYMNLFIRNFKKCIKYFEKSMELSYKLLRTYKTYCFTHIEDSKDSSL